MVTYFAPLLKNVHFVISKRNKIELASSQEPFGLIIIFVEGMRVQNFSLQQFSLVRLSFYHGRCKTQTKVNRVASMSSFPHAEYA